MFLSILSLLTIQSFADPALQEDPACDPAFVAFTSPFNGQIGVPVDVVPAAGLTNGCTVSPNYTLRLFASDVLIQSVTLESRNDFENLFEITPESALDPNTEYSMHITPVEGWGEQTIIQFTTGESPVMGLEGGPSGTVLKAEIDEAPSISYATLELTPAIDNDSLSIVRLKSPLTGEDPLGYFRVLEDLRSFETEVIEWHGGDVPDELCYTMEQRNGLGQWSDASEPFCMVPTRLQPEGRCSSIPLYSLSWFLPLLSITVVSRRQREC